MANNITFDTSGLQAGISKLNDKIQKVALQAIDKITDEVMRLSAREVPHDTGALQNSLGKETEDDLTIVVGYNKVYAARLHEHPEYHFQKGRKGKYLIDPILKNMNVFKQYAQQEFEKGLSTQ